ncbi:MAG: hypothetical protein AB1700_11770 [Bacillota bacterium]
MTQTSKMPEVLDGVGAVKRAAEYVSTKMGLGSPDEALALIDRGEMFGRTGGLMLLMAEDESRCACCRLRSLSLALPSL